MTNNGDNFTASVVDLLGLQAARLTNYSGNPPVALLSLRFEPAESYTVRNIALTQQQAIRLSDDLNQLLTVEGSWLYTEDAFHVLEESPFEIDLPASE